MKISLQREKGVVLIVSLVVLVLLTLLGLSGMDSTVMQERMAGNNQELVSAFEAAEAGLRDGETDVRSNLSPSSVFDSACNAGLCEPATSGNGVWSDSTLVSWHDSDTAQDVNTRVYGSATGAAALQNVRRQPAYVVERLNVVERGGSIVAGFGSQPAGEWYRVTAQGFGRTGRSKATVQSVIRK